MSHYTVIETQLLDAECIIAALKQMGYQPEQHEKPVNLYGYQGDLREQTAEIVIPRKQIGGDANDIGFKRDANGFKIYVSEYDVSSQHFNLKSFQQKYAEAKVLKDAKRLGYSAMNRAEVNGKVRFVLQTWR